VGAERIIRMGKVGNCEEERENNNLAEMFSGYHTSRVRALL
jgi:hypothetical protein